MKTEKTVSRTPSTPCRNPYSVRSAAILCRQVSGFPVPAGDPDASSGTNAPSGPLRFEVSPEGFVVPELPSVPLNRRGARGRRHAAGMAGILAGFACADVLLSRLVPEGVGLAILFLSLPCAVGAVRWFVRAGR